MLDRLWQHTKASTAILTIHQVTTTQKLASDAQIEKMEKELAKMRGGLTESVQLMEQREMNTNIEYVPFSDIELFEHRGEQENLMI